MLMGTNTVIESNKHKAKIGEHSTQHKTKLPVLHNFKPHLTPPNVSKPKKYGGKITLILNLIQSTMANCAPIFVRKFCICIDMRF